MFNIGKGIVSDLGQETKRHISWQKTAGDGPTVPTVRQETLTPFQVDSRRVTTAGTRPQLDNGDEVVVAGIGSGSFKGLAFKNLSENVIRGNNLPGIIFALLLILPGLIITSERLLSWGVIDFHTYRDFFSNGPRSFGTSLPGRPLLTFPRFAIGIFGSISLTTGFPKLIACVRIKDA